MATSNQVFHYELRKVRGRFTPEQQNDLAFLCSALSPVRTAEQLFIDAEIKTCNWIHVFALASNRLVAPLLFARLHQKKVAKYCPEDFIAALAAFHDANKARNDNHRKILFEAIQLLNQAGITPQLLKGAHALVGKMPDHNERVIGDIDILVPEAQIDRAHAALLRGGFYNNELPTLAITDPNIDRNHHHLRPLFHSSGSAYIELHRFPNHSNKHSSMTSLCFDPESMNLVDNDEGKYLYNQPWQLLLYNQVHHYYSTISRKGLIDLRHLSDQSALLNEINDLDLLKHKIELAFPRHFSLCYLQLKLLGTFFNDYIPPSMTLINKSDQGYYHDILKIFQHAYMTIYKRKFLLLMKLTWGLIKSGRIKKRLFNIAWYRTRPEVLRKL